MIKILQSIPYPTYTTAERDLLVDVLKNTLINNSDTGKVEEFDGVSWIEQGSGGTVTVDAVPTDGSNNPVASNGVFDALANKVNTSDQTAVNVSVDATGFNGNLAPTDTNQQLVNQKLDDLIIPTNTNNILNNSTVVGITTTDALNAIDAQLSANQLTFASIYGYYNFI